MQPSGPSLSCRAPFYDGVREVKGLESRVSRKTACPILNQEGLLPPVQACSFIGLQGFGKERLSMCFCLQM